MLKRIILSLLGIISIFLLLGCSESSQPSPELKIAQNMGDEYICKNSSTCNTSWERAQIWVTKHSYMKVQMANNTLIQTYNSTGSPFSFVITKEPLGNGVYKIKMDISKASVGSPEPEASQVKKAFYYYLKNGKDLLSPVPKGFYFPVYIR